MPKLAHYWTGISLLILTFSGVWIWYSTIAFDHRSENGQTIPYKGFIAPDFSLADQSGEMVHLSDLAGKSVIINFWASWCLPCREEMPALQKIYKAYESQDLIILAVNATDQDSPEQALAFVEEVGATFPILFDSKGKGSRLYQISAFPTTFFVDRQGIIQEVIIGGPMSEALLRTRVEKLLNNLSSKPGLP